MRRNTIKITVTGGAKTGKSTVIAHIARMLQDSGFSVSLQAGSVDGKTTRAVLRDKARLAHVMALSDVRIEEQVVQREQPVAVQTVPIPSRSRVRQILLAHMHNMSVTEGADQEREIDAVLDKVCGPHQPNAAQADR